MGMDKNPAGLDSDLAALLPSGATVNERLYAQVIDDGRAMHDARMAADEAARVATLAETKRHNLACEANATEQLRLIAQQDPGFSKEDRLFIDCVHRGVEARKQTMSSTTGRDTVMQDVVRDGTWIGYQVYNRIAAELGLEPRPVPADL